MVTLEIWVRKHRDFAPDFRRAFDDPLDRAIKGCCIAFIALGDVVERGADQFLRSMVAIEAVGGTNGGEAGRDFSERS